MDNQHDDILNASQIIHLALQKMDGIIANNSEAECLSIKSDHVVSNEDINFDSQTSSPYLNRNGNHLNFSNNSVNKTLTNSNDSNKLGYSKKQDKLNRLLEQLKEYSKDDNDNVDELNGSVDTMSEEHNNHSGRSELNGKFNKINSINSNSLNNGGSNVNSTGSNSNNPSPSSVTDNLDNNNKQHQQVSQQTTPSLQSHGSNSDKSLDYLHHSQDSADASKELDRNSSILHQLGLGNEFHHGTNSHLERMAQLESIIGILRNQLLNTEDLFKKALLSKKALENSNCDLLTVVDKLKLDLAHSESRQKLIKEHNIKLETDIELYKNRLLEKETEVSSLRLTMAKIVRATGYVLSDNELALLRGKTIASDFIKNKLIKDTFPENVSKPPYSKHNAYYSEPSSRRESVSSNFCGRLSPVVQPVRFHSAQPSPSSTPPTRASHKIASSTVPNSPVLRSTSAENMKMDSEHESRFDFQTPENGTSSPKGKNKSRYNKSPYSTLPHNSRAIRHIQKQLEENERMADIENRKRYGQEDGQTLMSQSLIEGHAAHKAMSMPSSPITSFKSSMHTPTHQPSGAVTFAQDDEMIPSSLKSSTNELGRNGIAPPRMIFDNSKPKGLKRIFSRKRSTSSLSGISDSFTRGGTRATSGPRLGYGQEKKFQNIKLPFSQWDTTLVADWFTMIGLGMYVQECKRWCQNGEHLMRSTSAEVEKELGIRNLLHRKKLRLAVASMNDEEDELLKNAGKLDYLWVARWLDDIGLPQYKDAFIDARVDGRVLHYLTVEDLFYLKVTSQLHFASIRAGIRILRENNYNGQCLKRRGAPEESNQTEWESSEVALWSSHRVMEWLRSIDLSEYAPNLRGSGVHGALILFENAFNSDLFATLLSIPTNKTLLRRHITAKFKQLIGDELSKIKLDYECQPNYSPMIPGSKVKAHKKGHFTLRKKRSDYELTDYVCPMTPAITTRATLMNMFKESKSKQSPTNGEHLYHSLSNRNEWKNVVRQNSLTSTKSLQCEPSPSPVKQHSFSNGSPLTQSNKASPDKQVINNTNELSDSVFNENVSS